MNKLYLITALTLVLFSCKKEETAIITYLDIPFSGINSEPSLHVTKSNSLILSWIDNDTISSKLFMSTLKNDTNWSAPNRIAEGKNWFVNWADFPSVTSFGTTNLIAHYLEKSAEGSYDYNIKMRVSNDNGNTWQTAFKPHTDNTNSEHGFVSMSSYKNNTCLALWLDGRNYAYSKLDSTITKEMTLRSAIIDKNGKLVKSFLVDDRVCDCCQTDLVANKQGAIAVYRNRSEEEIRDIYYTKLENDIWSTPKPIFNDNWKIAGCPVNGPRIDAINNTIAVVWFTMYNEIPTIKLAFSNDFGNSFNKPVIISEKSPLGRVDIKLIDEQSAFISWLDTENDEALIYTQKISMDGSKSERIEITETSKSRSSGFPRMEIKNNNAYITWTETSDPSTIKMAKINLNAID